MGRQKHLRVGQREGDILTRRGERERIAARDVAPWIAELVGAAGKGNLRAVGRILSDHAIRNEGAYRVVEITIGGDPTSIDPARPELLVALPVYNDLGVVKKRRFRWLLDNVAATDRPGATVLGTRGPSVAYVDLDGTHASVTMIEAKKANLELLCDKDTAMLAVTFGGVTQRFPVYDERTVKIAERIRPRSIATAALGAEIGYKVGYVLIALSAVEAGHVRKAVFALLPRSRG